ncbi:MAG: Rieske 2Fe-2S domain-containing protein [Gammaproteobacteria bacterium]|nr:MAG: Rieske 2Fe-2S domain-containing protein [Gammaproteobacteria bacterium]
MSQEELIIATVDEIADPGSKGLSINQEGTKLELFIVKKDAKIVVYQNSCPHTQGPLDWTADQFLDMDSNYIMCANHGALFEINTGLCVYGPCKAESLKTLPFMIKDGDIYLTLQT